MKRLDLYVKKARSMGVSRAKIIDTKNVVVENWVRLRCLYGCKDYSNWLTCPPHTPTPDYTRKMLGEYTKGLLMQIENISFTEGTKIGVKFNTIVANLEREIFLDGYYKAFGMVSGTCKLCQICDTTKTCKHPYEARPSMEACGIDVYQTARNSGFKLEVVKSKDSLFSRVGLILIE